MRFNEVRNAKRRIVVIRDYDPSWPVVFSKLATAVKSALGSLVVAIEHIGSTAVPGLAAKPIIDLDVVLHRPTIFPKRADCLPLSDMPTKMTSV
jgi:GrpB-like predicted nucleotidyltransferase (UPF0157 family)